MLYFIIPCCYRLTVQQIARLSDEPIIASLSAIIRIKTAET